VDNQQNDRDSSPTGAQRMVRYSRQAAIAMEIPFTLAGSVMVAGFFGYWLDQWLHSSPWLMTGLGAFGFITGMWQVIHKVKMRGSGSSDGTRPS
jgi:F0F1-type ATP synthase assembly protein I